MEFTAPLIRGVLLQRYKRFFADVRLDDGTIVTAHCPNSGSMLSVKPPGAEVWLSRASNPLRKLGFTWELVRIGETLVGINTGRPNALVMEAIGAGRLVELAGYPGTRGEVRYGRNSRIDILLEAADRPPCYVEVKNVTLKRDDGFDGRLEFPDAVTERGRKHLLELTDVVRQGMRAVVVFLAQRQDGGHMAIASDIDPSYALTFRHAIAAGVEAVAYACEVSVNAVRLDRRLPIVSA
jgi:sugar fermentation stimulation protein A